MAAVARIDLGLSSREFWEMTPRQFSVLYDRYHEKMRGLAAMHGHEIKARPKRGMGPEVFRAFEAVFEG